MSKVATQSLKSFVYEEARRLNMRPGAIYMRIARGHYPWLYLKRVNKRVVFVDQERAFDWMGENPGLEKH